MTGSDNAAAAPDLSHVKKGKEVEVRIDFDSLNSTRPFFR